MIVNINHWHIWDIPNNVSLVLPSDMYMLHDNNSSKFTLFDNLGDFYKHKTKVINVESMDVDENVQCVDKFIDDNVVQYDDTLEGYIDDKEDVKYEYNEETVSTIL